MGRRSQTLPTSLRHACNVQIGLWATARGPLPLRELWCDQAQNVRPGGRLGTKRSCWPSWRLDPKWPQGQCSTPPAHPSAHMVATSTLRVLRANLTSALALPSHPPTFMFPGWRIDGGTSLADATQSSLSCLQWPRPSGNPPGSNGSNNYTPPTLDPATHLAPIGVGADSTPPP